jgi:hypothetical protein
MNNGADEIGETTRCYYLLGVGVLVNKTRSGMDGRVPQVILLAHFFFDLPAALRAIATICARPLGFPISPFSLPDFLLSAYNSLMFLETLRPSGICIPQEPILFVSCLGINILLDALLVFIFNVAGLIGSAPIVFGLF